MLAFLDDGESWSSSALAIALRRESAHRAAGARLAGGRRQSAVVRPRARAPLDDAAGAGIHDDVVTPGAAADVIRISACIDRRLKSSGSTDRSRASTTCMA